MHEPIITQQWHITKSRIPIATLPNSTKAKNIKEISKNDFVRLEGLASRLIPVDTSGKISAVVPPDMELAERVYNSAIKAGLSKDEANILASNAATRFLDMQFTRKSAIAKFKSQGMSDIEATKKSDLVVIKYINYFST